MVKQEKITEIIGRRAMEAVEFLVYTMLFIAGVWILSPFFSSENSPTIAALAFAKVLGLWMGGLSIAGYTALIKTQARWRVIVRSFTTYAAAVTILFLTILRMTAYPTQIINVSPLILSLIACVCYLKIKWDRK